MKQFLQNENLLKYFAIERTHKQTSCKKCGETLFVNDLHIRTKKYEQGYYIKSEVFCLPCMLKFLKELNS